MEEWIFFITLFTLNMTIEETIKKAYEGGLDKSEYSNLPALLLKPVFWQSLGKAMKWGEFRGKIWKSHTEKLAGVKEMLEEWKEQFGKGIKNCLKVISISFIEDCIWMFNEVLKAQDLISYERGREVLEDEQRRDMSWVNWEEGFAETWMDINPNHGQANAKCYIKNLVDKYVEKAREEEREKCVKIVTYHLASGLNHNLSCRHEISQKILNSSPDAK